jgi:WD40 repeat protein
LNQAEIRTLKLKGLTSGEFVVVMSPDGKRLASNRYWSTNDTVKVWDATTGQLIHTFPKPGIVTSRLTFRPDGKWLAWGRLDETVTVVDVTTGQEVRTQKGPGAVVMNVAFSPDGNRLALVDWNGSVQVYDASTEQDLVTLKGYNSNYGLRIWSSTTSRFSVRS